MNTAQKVCRCLRSLADDARPTVVQQSLCGYLDGAMSADDLGPSLLTWASCINKAGSVEALRLLETDPKAGYVINQCSQYYGLRNAKTVQEWISLFFYIVLTELANVSPRVLPRKDDDRTLTSKCLGASLAIRRGTNDLGETVRVRDVIMRVFRAVMLPSSVVLCSWMWSTSQDARGKVKTPQYSFFRLELLLTTALSVSYQENKKLFGTTTLTIANLIMRERAPRSATKDDQAIGSEGFVPQYNFLDSDEETE